MEEKKTTKKKTTKKATPKEPEITTIGIFKDGGGWKYAEITTQGDKVIKKDISDHATRKAYVYEQLKIDVVKKYWRDTE